MLGPLCDTPVSVPGSVERPGMAAEIAGVGAERKVSQAELMLQSQKL